ncbi:AbrB/MazE/SpoVT family DNA-binding domain-containing protein [Candidatus Pacearchaeota archaeon]|nr:AbrB/MazE/SpoVT family DNA-binding domain-containing protein [Candidatus Pacearchaeota archaeon]
MNIEITKITSKGQVVIPQDIRQRNEIEEGEKFIVYDMDDSIILKRVKNLEKVRDTKELEKTFSSLWKTASSKNVGKEDIETEIAFHRKEKHAKGSS